MPREQYFPILNQQIELYFLLSKQKVIIRMTLCKKFSKTMAWSNQHSKIIQRNMRQVQDRQYNKIKTELIDDPANEFAFYNILPNQKLPTLLQKMPFKTIHNSQKQFTKTIKIRTPGKGKKNLVERRARNKLKEQGHILLLSEIYDSFGEEKESHQAANTAIKELEGGTYLDLWEKNKLLYQTAPSLQSRKSLRNSFAEQAIKGKDKNHCLTKQCLEIQRRLNLIQYTHKYQKNPIQKSGMIEQNSKNMKKMLDSRIFETTKNQQQLKKLLIQTRVEYHQLFSARKAILTQEQKAQKSIAIQQMNSKTKSYIFFPKSEKFNQYKYSKEEQLLNIEESIEETKEKIEAIEKNIELKQQELNALRQAQNYYYEKTLRTGIDCRENGLVWVMNCLKIRESNLDQYDFPNYMDKSSKSFLITKIKLEQQLELLTQKKKQFMQKIREDKTEPSNPKRISTRKCLQNGSILKNNWKIDSIEKNNQQAKKYRNSRRSVNLLNQQYKEYSKLFTVKNSKKFVKKQNLSSQLDGFSSKQVYSKIEQRIKNVNFNEMRKDFTHKNSRLIQDYQVLLKSIKQMHIKIQDLELAHKQLLLQMHKNQKEKLYQVAAGCFGSRTAYDMVIKHCCWKNEHKSTQGLFK